MESAVFEGAKVVSWWCRSESITTPSPIGSLEVRFTGKSSKKGVTMELLVKDSEAGFPAIAASGFTFTSAEVNVTHSFLLDEAALTYVNSVKVVTLKVKGTGTASFNLSTDQILFIASP